MTDKAKALLAEHRANWYYWNDNQRTNFLRRCRRLAEQLDPRGTENAIAIMILDQIETRTGRSVWPQRQRLKQCLFY